MKIKRIVFVLAYLLFIVVFVACENRNIEADINKEGRINVGAMNGPTMMGLGQLYDTVSNDSNIKYTITKEATPDAIVAGLANKTFDAACLPANNAAILFNTGNVDIKVAAINTKNVLYVLQKEGTDSIATISDLGGKTVYLPGQGSTPEFALRYLLSKIGISNVTLEFENEGIAIAAGLKVADSKYNYAVLPQPVATVATSGNGAALQTLNLTDEWKRFNPNSDIITGVLVVRTAFLKNNKDAFDQFMLDYKQSIEFMTDEANIDKAAKHVIDMDIISQVSVAKNALPKCGITFIEKYEMKSMLEDFYAVLYEQNVNSIGGRLPLDSFYYI